MGISTGDHVIVGKKGAVHWIVTKIRGDKADLKSGMSGQVRTGVPVENLRPYKRGTEGA